MCQLSASMVALYHITQKHLRPKLCLNCAFTGWLHGCQPTYMGAPAFLVARKCIQLSNPVVISCTDQCVTISSNEAN